MLRLHYVKNHPTTAKARAIAAVTAAFMYELSYQLSESELELCVIKNRTREPHICHFHDYTDPNQCMLDAMNKVFPNEGEDGVDIQDRFVAELMDASWELARKFLNTVYLENA